MLEEDQAQLVLLENPPKGLKGERKGTRMMGELKAVLLRQTLETENEAVALHKKIARHQRI